MENGARHCPPGHPLSCLSSIAYPIKRSAETAPHRSSETAPSEAHFRPQILMPGTPFGWDNPVHSTREPNGRETMRKRISIGLAAVVIVLGAVAFFGYRKRGLADGSARDEALALMPTDASAVVFADFDELRQAPFIAKLYAWAPKPPVDADYAQFVKETGFNYQRDLQRIKIGRAHV